MNGKLIKERRTELGLTQLKLALEVGVTPAIVYNWESGRATASTQNLRRLAKALDVSMEDLLEPEEAAV